MIFRMGYIWIVGYLYMFWHGISMHGNSMTGWWNMNKVWVGRNPMDPSRGSSWWCLI